jgi:hypothetical protein
MKGVFGEGRENSYSNFHGNPVGGAFGVVAEISEMD